MMWIFPVRRVFGSFQELYMDSVDSLEQSIATVDRYTDPHESTCLSTCLVILAKKAGRYPVSYCVDKIQARWVLK